jgi:hypothetical protein
MLTKGSYGEGLGGHGARRIPWWRWTPMWNSMLRSVDPFLRAHGRHLHPPATLPGQPPEVEWWRTVDNNPRRWICPWTEEEKCWSPPCLRQDGEVVAEIRWRVVPPEVRFIPSTGHRARRNRNRGEAAGAQFWSESEGLRTHLTLGPTRQWDKPRQQEARARAESSPRPTGGSHPTSDKRADWAGWRRKGSWPPRSFQPKWFCSFFYFLFCFQIKNSN